MKITQKIAVAALLAGSLTASIAQPNGTWTGQGTGSTNLNWSNPNNWAGVTPPGIFDKVYFEDLFFNGWTNKIGAVNNIVDTNSAVGTLYYSAYSKVNTTNNHYHTTLIPGGVTLTVGGAFGSSAPTMAVGDIPGEAGWVGASYTNYSQIQGAGALLVNDTAGKIAVGGSGGGISGGTFLDMSNLYTFTANVAYYYQAVNVDNPFSSEPYGTVFLARTNAITTTANGGAYPSFLLGCGANGNSANFPVMILGVQNTFNSDAFVVAGNANQSAMLSFTNCGTSPASINGLSIGSFFLQNTGSFKLRGSAGGISRAAFFNLGDGAARPVTMTGGPIAAGTSYGIADFRNGTVDIMADKIYVGHGPTDGGVTNAIISDTTSGALLYESGSIDVNNLYVAYKEGTNRAVANGVLLLQSNATMTVNNNFYMAYVPDQGQSYGSSSATATNIVAGNAVLNIGGNLQHNDGVAYSQTNSVSTVSMRGGLINMFNNGMVNLYTLEGFGSISNASLITISNAFSPGLFSPAAQSIGTLNLSSNVQFLSSFPINFDIGTVTNIGAPFNDYVNIKGDVTFNNNPITLLYGGTPQVGIYTLMNYTGTKTGLLTFNNNTRSGIGLDQGQPGKIILVVTNWIPGTLTWNGKTNMNWIANGSAGPVNWGFATNQQFFQFDSVRFDDSVTTNAAGASVFTNICFPASMLFPSAMYFTNNSPFYCSNQNIIGSLNGTFNVTKDGTNTLWWSVGLRTNNYTGNWFINQGSVKVLDSSFSSGSGVFRHYMGYGNIYVTNGAALDWTNSSLLGAGNALYLSGTGPLGYSAPSNSAEFDGVLYGKTVSVPYFKARLANDATISTYFGAVGFTGITNGTPNIGAANTIPFGVGELSLNGYTLTVRGSNVNPFILQVVNASTAGDINFLGSPLRLRQSSITGSGTMRFTNNTVMQFNASYGLCTIGKNIQATNWALLCETNNTGWVGTNLFTGTVAVDESAPFIMPNFRGMLVSNDQYIEFDGPITGSAELYKAGRGPLILNGANTYSGNTWINGGSVIVGPSGTIPSSVITLNPLTATPPTTTTLDVSGTSFSLASGQTMNLNGLLPSDILVKGNLTVGSGSVLYGIGTVNGSLTLANGAELAPGGTNNQGQIVVSNNLTMNGAHLTWDVTPSFATSDGLVVNGDLNLTGVNTFTIDSIGGFAANGTNTLITYTGTRTGGLANLALNNPNVRFTLTLVDPATTPGKIQVVLTSPPGNLTWTGTDATNPTYWNVKSTTNWLNAGTNDIFANADFVTFDQSGATNTVDLGGASTSQTPLNPGNITVTNAAYLFRGAPGVITSSLGVSNGASLVISNRANNQIVGLGTVVDGTLSFRQPTNVALLSDLYGSGSIDKSVTTNSLRIIGDASGWNGTLNVNAGQVVVGQSNAIKATVTVASGATLDLGGQAIPNVTSMTVQGTGVDGFGAVNNRLAVSTTFNWFSNTVPSLTLGGDTTLGAISNAWGIQSLTGNGFNLTKTNSNDIWILTGSDIGVGNINIRQGRLFIGGNGTGLGIASSNILVYPGATLGFMGTNSRPIFGSEVVPPWTATMKNVILSSNASFLGLGFGSFNQTSIFSGPITFTNDMNTTVNSGATLMLYGNITGQPAGPTMGQLVAAGSGTLAMFGTNNWASNTWVQSATLMISNQMAIPTNTTIILSNSVAANPSLWLLGGSEYTNRTLRMSSTNGIVSVSGDARWWGPALFHGSGGFYIQGGTNGLDFAGPTITTNSVAITNIVSGTTNITVPSIVGGTFGIHGYNVRFRNALSLFVPPFGGSSAVSGAMQVGVGDGLSAAFDDRFTTLTLDNTNNWFSMFIERGRINLNTNNALPPGALISLNTLSAGVSDRRTYIDLHGYNQTLSKIANAFPFNGTDAIFNDSTTSDSTLTMQGVYYTIAPTNLIPTNCTTILFTDTLTNTVTPKKLHLMVTGGVNELLNSNTYSGFTTVTGGRLLVGAYSQGLVTTIGALQGTPSVNVSGTGFFGGNGYVGAPVTVDTGGTLIPGECLQFVGNGASLPPGIVTRTGQLLIDSQPLVITNSGRAWFCVDNNAGTNATVVGMSSVTYGGTLLVTNISPVAFTNGQVIKLFDAVPGNYFGAFTNVQVWGAVSGTSVNTNNLTVDGTISITSAVATTPVTITKARPNKNTLTLSWPADHIGWRLQVMTNTTASGMLVGGTTNFLQATNWVNCNGGPTPFNSTNLTISSTNVVYRLTYP
jgi:autotransporter-associated beta strand protein